MINEAEREKINLKLEKMQAREIARIEKLKKKRENKLTIPKTIHESILLRQQRNREAQEKRKTEKLKEAENWLKNKELKNQEKEKTINEKLEKLKKYQIKPEFDIINPKIIVLFHGQLFNEKPFDIFDNHTFRYDNKNERYYVTLDGKYIKPMILLYSRYLMCLKVGRILTEDEHVDHIDEDKNNDTMENLQILSKEEHIVKTNNSVKGKLIYSFYCIRCNKKVFKPENHLGLFGIFNGEKFYTCSEECCEMFRIKLLEGNYKTVPNQKVDKRQF